MTQSPSSQNIFFSAKIFFDFTVENDLIDRISTGYENDALSIIIHVKDDDEKKAAILELLYKDKIDKAGIQSRLAKLCHVHGLTTQNIQKVEFNEIEDCNWLLHVYQNFPPLTVNQFFIYGSHYEDKIPEGLIPLKIDAATAFGSGEHQTTKGCLLALQELKKQNLHFNNILDMGCGSGVLAIAAKKLWPEAKVTAVDIDPESILVTERHVKDNLPEPLDLMAGEGYQTPLISQNGAFDLILANILAKPLQIMAPDLAKNLKKGGYCILSGLLLRQTDAVLKAHYDQGLSELNRLPIENWQTLVLHT